MAKKPLGWGAGWGGVNWGGEGWGGAGWGGERMGPKERRGGEKAGAGAGMKRGLERVEQGPLEHLRQSSSSGQSSPPLAGRWLMERVRDWLPKPQETEQADHAVHWLTCQVNPIVTRVEEGGGGR